MLRTWSLLRRPVCQLLQRQNKSTLDHDCVVPAENDRMYVAWHPERDIPYEHTKPISATRREITAAAMNDSTPLNLPKGKLVFNNIRNEVEYLKRLTYTNKHRWFTQPKDRRLKRRAHDRDGL
ncbi:39S ribosomal protein L42, mitochondrial [Galendromus occidentalis]|uniref:Large ribosomal subunit protein mL42 n=1 Tax=Galendromus occidentalis TaxID=34638 RepID=A0AAJ6VZN3_9ACAR|nr:39S ribosomal protein L42, mitochondrial [Galendromus occidentalis]